jgi:hypothetical protein
VCRLGNDPGQRLAEPRQQFNVLEAHDAGHPLQALDRLYGNRRRRFVRCWSGVVGVEPTVRDTAADVVNGGIAGGDEPPGVMANSNGTGVGRAGYLEVGQRSWSRSG